MTDLVIRDLDPGLEARLRDRAAEKNRTVEDEVRDLLRGALAVGPDAGQGDDGDLATRITRRFKGIGLKPGEELQRSDWSWIPPRFKE